MPHVSGQVIAEGTGAPVERARVFALVDGAFDAPVTPIEALSDSDGWFHFDLPVGRYRIAAQREGFATPMSPFEMQLFDIIGEAVPALTVLMHKGGTITGRILDPSGHPVVGAGVTVLLRQLRAAEALPADLASVLPPPVLIPFGQDQSGLNGEFNISGLPFGEYVVAVVPRSVSAARNASDPGLTPTLTFYPGTASVDTAEPVTVHADEPSVALTVQLQPVRTFSVSGMAVDETGAALSNIPLMLMPRDEPRSPFPFLSMSLPAMALTDAGGRFSFANIPRGSYTLQASESGGGGFGWTEQFVIGPDGVPRSEPAVHEQHASMPGSIDVTIDRADLEDVTVVVPNLT